jgi:sRNA-binding regulator protein Hfq
LAIFTPYSAFSRSLTIRIFPTEGLSTMSFSSLLPASRFSKTPTAIRGPRALPPQAPFHSPVRSNEVDTPQRHAELFYLQKQIQAQTPMVIVLEDGERIEGCIEWYDRNSLKVRGRTRMLIYKSAIKYMYKLGDTGQQ